MRLILSNNNKNKPILDFIQSKINATGKDCEVNVKLDDISFKSRVAVDSIGSKDGDFIDIELTLFVK